MLIRWHRLQLILRPIEDQPLLIVTRAYFEFLEGDGNVLLTRAKEPANANHCRRNVAVPAYYEIGDITNLVLGIVINVGLVDIGNKQARCRYVRTRRGRGCSLRGTLHRRGLRWALHLRESKAAGQREYGS